MNCANCNCPLEECELHLNLGACRVCNCCFDLFDNVFRNPYFLRLEIEYQNELEQRKRILNGD